MLGKSAPKNEYGALRPLVELLIYVVIVVVGFFNLSIIEFYERFYEFTRAHEEWELDEIALLVPLALVCLIVFAFFRLGDLRRRTDDLKQAHEDLKRANDRLAEMARAREEFMAVACHELKSPLNGVINALRLMEMAADEEEKQESADLARKAAAQLGVLVDDVRDFSLMDQDNSFMTNEFDLGRQVEAIRLVADSEAKTKGLSLNVSLEGDRRLVGADAALRLIALNLIGNAVKFTEQGGVTVRFTYRTGDRPELELSVADTGRGIAVADLERIFEPYTRIDERTGYGLGLGLAIVKRLVEQLDGSIAVASEPDRGSTFTVVLPFLPA